MARVAFLVDEMFEDSEFRVPYDRVRSAGHEAASPRAEPATAPEATAQEPAPIRAA
jgi:putative intracellular protease/amidase